MSIGFLINHFYEVTYKYATIMGQFLTKETIQSYTNFKYINVVTSSILFLFKQLSNDIEDKKIKKNEDDQPWAQWGQFVNIEVPYEE